jgi:hypothetical protein
MTESEWLSCLSPEPMLDLLYGTLTQRKGRLFACACCRQLWHRVVDPDIRSALGLAERYADGEEDRKGLLSDGQWLLGRLDEDIRQVVGVALCTGAVDLAWQRYWASPPADGDDGATLAGQAVLLREIVGNPFRPPPRRSFPAHVVGLAEAVYAAFPAVSEQYRILADALQDLGEEQAAAHCREPLHVRGCHVVDWVLRKS